MKERDSHMDNLQRIYEKFDELGVDGNLMDLINAFQSDSTGAAYLDGVRFGMRFFLECVMND